MQNPTGFGFGAPAPAQTAPTGLSFGATSSTPASSGLFGTSTSVPGGGLFQNTMSTPAAPSLFGTTTTATATPAFGATPNFGATSMPGFGATTTPSFGATTTSSFGAAATSSFGATATPSFGATATPSFGATATPSFGATATPSFGATATPSFGATATPSFGATTTPSFGATATPSFGATTTSSFGAAPNTNLSFGGTPNSSLGFGGAAAPAFGATATSTTGFGAATSLAATQPGAAGFGATSTAPLFGAVSKPAPTFGFATATSTAAGSTNTSLSFNLGATAVSTPTTTTSATPVGLGGLATTQTKIVTTQKDITPKDQPLPNEILQTVEAFKELVKQQKIHSSDIARCSVRDFRKVEQDINQLTQLLSEVEGQLQKNMQLAEKLKYDTANCLKDVEIAQRTQDTPSGLQYENTAPLRFFLNLADKFERDMQILKVQIEGADNYVKNYRSPNALTPQDLHLGMRRLHESFVALAGRLHSVHGQVESQKETYLNTRKQLFNDHSNPFDALYNPTDENFQQILRYMPPKVATGPTPFSNLALGLTQPLGSQQNQGGISYSTPSTSAPTGFGSIGFGTSFGTQPPSSSLFGSSGAAQNPNAFQLQKPPTGNKRGKQ